jgi:hypothetical protein
MQVATSEQGAANWNDVSWASGVGTVWYLDISWAQSSVHYQSSAPTAGGEGVARNMNSLIESLLSRTKIWMRFFSPTEARELRYTWLYEYTTPYTYALVL